MRIITWNVNGLRAVLKKGFLDFVAQEKPDILCLQETKTNQALPLLIPDYEEFWQCGERGGYSGTLTLVKKTLLASRFTIPNDPAYELLHQEGRVVALRASSPTQKSKPLTIFNVYFPNGGQGEHRLQYKSQFYAQFLALTEKLLAAGQQIVVCGDVNTAHREIDLARPKENTKTTGFLPWERAWVSDYLATGMIDVWRQLHPQDTAYTWWSYRSAARHRDVGWRIDYCFVSKNLLPQVKNCEILRDTPGSDHAPVALDAKI